MNVRIDVPAPRRRVEARGATYSLEEWCKINHVAVTLAKTVMTNVLHLPVVESETLKREIQKYKESRQQ